MQLFYQWWAPSTLWPWLKPMHSQSNQTKEPSNQATSNKQATSQPTNYTRNGNKSVQREETKKRNQIYQFALVSGPNPRPSQAFEPVDTQAKSRFKPLLSLHSIDWFLRLNNVNPHRIMNETNRNEVSQQRNSSSSININNNNNVCALAPRKTNANKQEFNTYRIYGKQI